MKLLEMNAGELADHLLLLASPLAEICEDARISPILEEYSRSAGKGFAILNLGKLWAALLPLLLNDHRKSVLALLSVIEGRPPEELAKMNALELVADIRNAWRREIKPFFTQFEAMAQKP